ncbi:MAG: ferrochelatase [Gammaproteobacteria bacterium]|nr:ferrochelatase [Gammaproteobacteria bacterium]MDH4256177.1 ferrochelatase [Gammaproteobacteria bacterium]MDH5312186.1 ferrochelatase [Gammaproteobacteria bacterium]
MPRFDSSPQYAHGTPDTAGVLVVNLGTPDEPTTAAVRRYLRQFLSDPRVVEIPRPIWMIILYGFILPFRPARSAAAYRKIWTDSGAPLLLHSSATTDSLRQRLSARGLERVNVRLAMSYGEPSIDTALHALWTEGARRILVLPLYPQYSATTTASVFDAVTGALRKRRWVPAFRFVSQYHDEAGYIAALAASIRDHWATAGRGQRLMFSFHGIPRRSFLSGDPYHCQCQKTARLVAEELELGPDQWFVTFQSRLGKAEWLRPYTDETLRQWGSAGVGDIDVVCPGFAADCLETLEEIAIQNAGIYAEAGGGALRYIAALNAREDHVDFLAGLVERNLSGWPEASPGAGDAEERSKSAARARAMGAAS